MIKANHKKWARQVFNIYIKRELRKHFSHFYLVNEFPLLTNNEKILITPNHISWWDGFFIDHVCRNLYKRKIYIMMLEEQLKKYSFFKKLGAYSINPESNISIKESIKYSRTIIKDSNNVTVIYPQGEIEAFEKRPVNIKNGIKLILRNANNVVVLPVGFKIHYSNEKLPAVFTRFGNPISAETVVNNFDYYKKIFLENLDLLSQEVSNKNFIADILK